MKKRDIISLMIIGFVVIFDQLTKLWAVNTLKPIGTIAIIEDVFHFTYATNTGAAFSIFSNSTTFLTIVSFLALGILAFMYFSKDFQNSLISVALATVAAGAIGNLIDRVRLGYVVDFLDFRLINFAVFNIADVAINIGGALLLIYMFFVLPKEEKAAKQAAAEAAATVPLDATKAEACEQDDNAVFDTEQVDDEVTE